MSYLPSEGVLYFVNPVAGGMSFYLNFELEPDHIYKVEVTSDAVNYRHLFDINTKGAQQAFYHTWTVGKCGDPWPRFTDMGLSDQVSKK